MSPTSQTYSVTNQSTTASSQHNNCCRCCGAAAGRRLPRSWQQPRIPHCPDLTRGCRSRQDQLPIRQRHQLSRAPGKAAPTVGLRRSGSPVGPASAAIRDVGPQQRWVGRPVARIPA
jgi:hypothetical protein